MDLRLKIKSRRIATKSTLGLQSLSLRSRNIVKRCYNPSNSNIASKNSKQFNKKKEPVLDDLLFAELPTRPSCAFVLSQGLSEPLDDSNLRESEDPLLSNNVNLSGSLESFGVTEQVQPCTVVLPLVSSKVLKLYSEEQSLSVSAAKVSAVQRRLFDSEEDFSATEPQVQHLDDDSIDGETESEYNPSIQDDDGDDDEDLDDERYDAEIVEEIAELNNTLLQPTLDDDLVSQNLDTPCTEEDNEEDLHNRSNDADIVEEIATLLQPILDNAHVSQNLDIFHNTEPLVDSVVARRQLASIHLPILPKNLQQYEPFLPKFDIPSYAVNAMQIIPSAAGGKKSKRYFCPYCTKDFSSLPKHLLKKHTDTELVMKLMSSSKDDEDRADILTAIRIWGTCMYNSNRLYNKGVLRVLRRPSATKGQADGSSYRCCPNCSMLLKRHRLHRHYNYCTKNPKKHAHHHLQVESKRLMDNIHCDANVTLRRRIFPVLKDDECTKAIRYDEAVIMFGNNCALKYSLSPHHDKMIRANLRILGRLILSTRQLNSDVTDLASLMIPPMSDTVQTAILMISKFSYEAGEYGAPATATHAANILRQAAELWKIACIHKERADAEHRVERFIWILKKQIIPFVNATVTENRTKQQRRKKILLPEVGDIELLNKYVVKGYQHCASIVQDPQSFSFSTWKQLGMYVMVHLILYNRRRPGEVERIFLDDFRSVVTMDVNDPLYASLCEEERQTAGRLSLFLIRGKLNRTVNVLLSTTVKDCIDIFLSKRQMAGVPQSNPYLFGLPNEDVYSTTHRHLEAGGALRLFSLQCNAKNPALLRTTILRKHLATNAAAYNLPDNVASDLADHMGHDRAIHKDIYRQPTFQRSVLPVAAALEKALGVDHNEERYDPVLCGNSPPSTSQKKERSAYQSVPVTPSKSVQNKNTVVCKTPSQECLTKKKKCAILRYCKGKQAQLQRALTAKDLEEALKLPALSGVSLPVLKLFYDNYTKVPHTPLKRRYSPKKVPPNKEIKCRDVTTRRRWSSTALAVLRSAFSKYIKVGVRTLPSKDEILQAQRSYPAIQDRDVACVKVAVSNMRNRLNR